MPPPELFPPHELRKLVSALAHEVLGEVLRRGFDGDCLAGELVGTDKDDEHRLQIVISLTRYDGPARFIPARPADPADPPAAPVPPPLRDVEAAAVEAAPARTARPVTMKELARRAGYGYNSHFLEAVRGLIDRGLLTRLRGGVRRAQ